MAYFRFSPAKINLTLHILGRRPDGYHELFSLVRFADYGDRLSFIPGGEENRLEVSGKFSGDIEGENIILKAASVFGKAVPGLPGGTFHLEKNLPVASGMGGGSANAAATLDLLSEFVPDGFDSRMLAGIALQLGADVPVCLGGKSVYMSGTGEVLEPALHLQPGYAVLVNPLVSVSTAEVFTRLNAKPIANLSEEQLQAQRGCPASALFFDPEQHKNFASWLGGTRNDLEKPAIAIAPEIRIVLDRLGQQEGCFLARMSGSGATCFGLYETRGLAVQSARLLVACHEGWWVQYVTLK